MTTRSLRNRLYENTNLWPGFVDVLATLLIVIIFILMVFTVSQIYLSDAISGKDRVLNDLKNQINELSKILVIESKQKEESLSKLLETQEELNIKKDQLQSEQFLSEKLQTDISKKRSEIFVQEQNIIALSEQIKELLSELRIVAKALETYEGEEVNLIETEGLGERINKALATRIDQLKTLNNRLDLTNQKLETSEKNLENKISELLDLNNKLSESKNETEIALKLVENTNSSLILKDEELQNQILKYQEITDDLIKLNESLGLKDANVQEQLKAIQIKNDELTKLSEDLIAKDSTIFDLRGKISELNNILSITEDKKISQKSTLLEQEQTIYNLLLYQIHLHICKWSARIACRATLCSNFYKAKVFFVIFHDFY